MMNIFKCTNEKKNPQTYTFMCDYTQASLVGHSQAHFILETKSCNNAVVRYFHLFQTPPIIISHGLTTESNDPNSWF